MKSTKVQVQKEKQKITNELEEKVVKKAKSK